MTRGCWICGCPDSSEVKPCNLEGAVTSDDFNITDAHYGRTARIIRCLKCGFQYADPLPADDLVEMYSNLVDAEYNQGRESRIEPLRRIVNRCIKLNPGAKTLLDIGASTGLLCRAAADLGLNSIGVEPSKWATDIARHQEHVEVLEGVFPHPLLVDRKFDLVTLVDVIEHLSDPIGLLREIRSALQPGGVLAVVTPDVESTVARLLGRKWWHYRVAHVCYFSRHTMNQALNLAGFRPLCNTTYSWYFPAGYLAKRVEQYLPTSWIHTGLNRFKGGRWLLARQVPLNLRDSRVYYATLA